MYIPSQRYVQSQAPAGPLGLGPWAGSKWRATPCWWWVQATTAVWGCRGLLEHTFCRKKVLFFSKMRKRQQKLPKIKEGNWRPAITWARRAPWRSGLFAQELTNASVGCNVGVIYPGNKGDLRWLERVINWKPDGQVKWAPLIWTVARPLDLPLPMKQVWSDWFGCASTRRSARLQFIRDDRMGGGKKRKERYIKKDKNDDN